MHNTYQLAKAANRIIIAWFLRGKLVAWEAKHDKATALVVLVQLLETIKLWRKTTLARSIHDKHDLTLELRRLREGGAISNRFQRTDLRGTRASADLSIYE